MSELQPTARQVLVLRLVESAVKDQLNTVRGTLVEQMGSTGVERVRVTDETGANLGTVSWTSGRASVKVVDQSAFTAWVKRNHPTEIVETVRDSFTKKLFDEIKTKAEPGDETPIGPDGEVVPGLRVTHGNPYPSCKPTDEARQRMEGLLADVLALPAAERGVQG